MTVENNGNNLISIVLPFVYKQFSLLSVKIPTTIEILKRPSPFVTIPEESLCVR